MPVGKDTSNPIPLQQIYSAEYMYMYNTDYSVQG